MAYPLFTRVALKEDFPEYQLYCGDVATMSAVPSPRIIVRLTYYVFTCRV